MDLLFTTPAQTLLHRRWNGATLGRAITVAPGTQATVAGNDHGLAVFLRGGEIREFGTGAEWTIVPGNAINAEQNEGPTAISCTNERCILAFGTSVRSAEWAPGK
jgi:hypothetical protein